MLSQAQRIHMLTLEHGLVLATSDELWPPLPVASRVVRVRPSRLKDGLGHGELPRRRHIDHVALVRVARLVLVASTTTTRACMRPCVLLNHLLQLGELVVVQNVLLKLSLQGILV